MSWLDEMIVIDNPFRRLDPNDVRYDPRQFIVVPKPRALPAIETAHPYPLPSDPIEPCEFCGKSTIQRAVVDGVEFAVCDGCQAPPADVQVPPEPWWLRALRWLAR